MALSIVNNPTAIGAQGGVNSVNSKLAKTIKSVNSKNDCNILSSRSNSHKKYL